MGIVLVSDRNMQSLANYWRKHNSAISAVIYNDDGLDVANERSDNYLLVVIYHLPEVTH